MPPSPKFTPIKRSDGWIVSVPASMSGTGERVRKHFGDEKAALKFAQGLRSQWRKGERGGLISHELAMEAAASKEILDPLGIGLLEAAKMVARQVEERGGPETLADLLARALAENEMHWRPRYVADVEKLPRWVGADLMERRACDITPAVIDAALRENGAASQSTLEMRRRYVRAILNFKPKHRRSIHIAIMTPDQVEAMLAACESIQERRAVALLIYAGIRPNAEDGEISRLDWAAVGESEIYIAAEVSKTKSDRHIPITPRLAELIEGHPKRGMILPPDWKRRIQRIRAAAGVAGLQDITRHTFASHYLAAFGEDRTKQAMGHSQGSQTLFRHYRRAVTEEVGKAFFGVV